MIWLFLASVIAAVPVWVVVHVDGAAPVLGAVAILVGVVVWVGEANVASEEGPR